MAEFRVVRRSDVPVGTFGPRVRGPLARLHKSGVLFLNVESVAVLGVVGNQDCTVLVEFDEESLILKITTVDKPPRGITANDLFLLRTRLGKNKRPLGMLYLRPLLRHIGCPINGKHSQQFPVQSIDPANRSISLIVPAEQLAACEDSSDSSS